MTAVATAERSATKIRTLIADDEPLARERLRALLARHADIEIIGECANGSDTIQTITELRPDLVLLDVEMPQVDGFAVLEALDADAMPTVVFVSAHDQYAVRAFEAHALDYILKPFDEARVDRALRRVRGQLARAGGARTIDPGLVSLLEELRDRRRSDRLVVKTGGRVVFLRTEDIDWVEASGNYVRLHVGGEAHLLRESMKNMERRLDPSTFVRIHRSAIVNVDRIRELEPWFHGEYIVILRDGTRLTSSRVFSDRLNALID
ncbi:MAG: LytR/AlgR family response regulator transcription factor [Gemmatimonadaceae bacterium]